MSRAGREWYIPIVLGVAALVPGIAPACAASGEDPRFDAVDCLELRANSAAPLAGNVLLNRCGRPIAMLVVMCDLAAQPACKADPIYSKGWSTRRGVEYVAPARTSVGSLAAARKAGGTRNSKLSLPPLAPYAPGLQKGWRAQIAACKLDLESPASQDPCVARLAELKRSLDAGHGRSMRAALKEMRRRCST